LETEEQTLEREQNERDALEALGDYKCDAGMSVENVPAVGNIKAPKGRFSAHKFSTGGRWVWRRVWKRRRVLLASLQSSVSQTRIAGINREDFGIHNYWVLLAVVKE
jgi:hypothetical protein